MSDTANFDDIEPNLSSDSKAPEIGAASSRQGWSRADRVRLLWVLLVAAAVFAGGMVGAAYNKGVSDRLPSQGTVRLAPGLKPSDFSPQERAWYEAQGLTLMDAETYDAKTQGMNPLLLCGLSLFVIVGLSAGMLWFSDQSARALGRETRNRPFLPWQTTSRDPGPSERLWERQEAGERSRKRRTAVLAVAICIPAAAIGFFLLGPVFAFPAVALVAGGLLLFSAAAIGFRAVKEAPDLSREGVALWMWYGKDAANRAPEADVLSTAPVVPLGSQSTAKSAIAQMAIRTGGVTPLLRAAPSASLNAFLMEDGSIAITQGLRSALSDPELRAVFAWLLCRAREPDVVDSDLHSLASHEAKVTDTEALRVLGDPAAMLAAWKKILAAENDVPGQSKVPSANMLVPPGATRADREARLSQLRALGGAMTAGV